MSMSYQTTIPAGKVKEEDLIALIEQIRCVTKEPILIEQSFVLSTASTAVADMLSTLVAALPAEPGVRRNGHKPKKPAKGKAAMTSHQVRIEETGEVISKQAFNKRLAAGEVSELTNVINAKGELFVVVDGALVKGPQV